MSGLSSNTFVSRCDHTYLVCRRFLVSRELENVDEACEWFR